MPYRWTTMTKQLKRPKIKYKRNIVYNIINWYGIVCLRHMHKNSKIIKINWIVWEEKEHIHQQGCDDYYILICVCRKKQHKTFNDMLEEKFISLFAVFLAHFTCQKS